MQIGSLEIQLLADMARLSKDMKDAKAVVGDTMGKIQEYAGLAQKALLGLGGSFAALTSLSAMKGLVDGVISAKVELEHLSQMTGATVESLSAISAVGKLTGTSTDTVGSAINKMQKNLASATEESRGAAKAIEVLGLNFKEFSNLKADQQMLEAAKAMARFEDGGGKAAVAMALWGKAGAQLLPMLKDLAEKDMLVGKTTAESALQAEEYEKNLKRLSAAGDAWKRVMVDAMLPAMVDITNAMVEGRKQAGLWGSVVAGLDTLGNSVFDWQGSQQRKNIKNLQADLAELRALPNGIRFTWYGAMEDVSKLIQDKTGELDKATQQYLKIGAFGNASAGGGRGKTPAGTPKGLEALDPNFNAKPERIGAQDHFAANLINTLITEYNALFGSMSKVDEITRKLDASSKDVSATQREQALELAAGIDMQKRASDAAKNIADLAHAELTAREKLEAEYDKELSGLNDLARAQAFELSLLNKQPEVVAKARFERELLNQELKAEAALVALGVQAGYDEVRMMQERAKITRELTDRRTSFAAIQADERDKMFNPQRGADEGIKAYMLEISKAGDIMNKTVVNAFKGMEDALVNFVKTGKLDFKSLADSVISEMIRMQIQQSITKPLGALVQDNGGLFGLGKKIFGGFFADGGSPPVGVPSIVGERGPELFIPNTAGSIIPSGGFGGMTINQPIYLTANNASAETVGQIRSLMPGLLAENKRVIEGVIQQAMRQRGGRLSA